jgi:formylglycine-generating enzyme required for sulfatase activity
MSGNVHEWIQDHYKGSYEGAPVDGSSWEDVGSSKRIVRGGSWTDIAHICRSSYRGKFNQAYQNHNLGVRPARSIE